MFKSKGKFEVTQRAKDDPNQTSSQNDEQERTKRTPIRSAASNKDQVGSILSPSPRLVNFSTTSPSLVHQLSTSPSRYPPPSATSNTSKHSWETVTVPLRNERSMKIKYYKGPTPKLKPTESAIKIYPDTPRSMGVITNIAEMYDEDEDEDDGVFVEDDGVFAEDDVQYSSTLHACTCTTLSPYAQNRKRSAAEGRHYFIMRSERVFKICSAILCFSVAMMFAIALMVILMYHLLK